jgi:hypothetical protein
LEKSVKAFFLVSAAVTVEMPQYIVALNAAVRRDASTMHNRLYGCDPR